MRITEMTVKENRIKELWRESRGCTIEYANCSKDQRALYGFINYLRINDYFNQTDHSDTVRLLYFGSEQLSLTEICRKRYIDEKTLYRYRRKYVELFDIVYNLSDNDDFVGQFPPDV